MTPRKALASAAFAIMFTLTGATGCGEITNCTETASNALNGKSHLANPLPGKHGSCIAPVNNVSRHHRHHDPAAPPSGPWDCFKAIGGWNCKKPGVEPTLFPANPNG